MLRPSKKVAVVLSGCGFKDGAEITESVSTLIALSEFGIAYQCFAPNMEITPAQHSSMPASASVPLVPRRLLDEAGRICRGQIQDIVKLDPGDFDAVIFPGGYGAALHLCTWAKAGARCEVHPEVERVVKGFHAADKPIGAICIAPAMIARILGSTGLTLTIGEDPETAAEIAKTGAHHVRCSVTEYVSDRDHKVLTTPAYMYDHAKPNEVFTGVRKMIKELAEMA